MNKKIMAESSLTPLSIQSQVAHTLTTTSAVPASYTATPNTAAGGQQVIISGPLVSVAEMSVRDDRDIRTLSTQLKTDMTRELRAQGVLA